MMCLSMLPLPIMAQKEEKVDTTFNLHELVVTGTRTPKLLKDAPILTRLISSSDIGKADATNVQTYCRQRCQAWSSRMP